MFLYTCNDDIKIIRSIPCWGIEDSVSVWILLLDTLPVSSFLLIANETLDKSQVFNYVGKYSNVIEKTRAAEIASSIQQQKDLGCQAAQVITINEDKPTCTKSQVHKFWSYLGVTDSEKINGAIFHLIRFYLIILSLIQ